MLQKIRTIFTDAIEPIYRSKLVKPLIFEEKQP